jgi:hypothetical protein
MAIVQQSLGLHDKLMNETALKNDEHIVSPCGRFKAIMQADGNFVIYKDGETPTWGSGSDGKGQGPYHLKMQGDGNLVIYDSAGTPTWASDTHGKGVGPYELEMQCDGNLVIYDQAHAATWATGTNEEL